MATYNFLAIFHGGALKNIAVYCYNTLYF